MSYLSMTFNIWNWENSNLSFLLPKDRGEGFCVCLPGSFVLLVGLQLFTASTMKC